MFSQYFYILYTMYCRLQNKIEQESMLVSNVKNNLINNCAVWLKFSNKRKSKD